MQKVNNCSNRHSRSPLLDETLLTALATTIWRWIAGQRSLIWIDVQEKGRDLFDGAIPAFFFRHLGRSCSTLGYLVSGKRIETWLSRLQSTSIHLEFLCESIYESNQCAVVFMLCIVVALFLSHIIVSHVTKDGVRIGKLIYWSLSGPNNN
jgi:hypothetical protein